MSNIKLKLINKLINQLSPEDSKTFKQSIYDELYQIEVVICTYKEENSTNIIVSAKNEKEAVLKSLDDDSIKEMIIKRMLVDYEKQNNSMFIKCKHCETKYKIKNFNIHYDKHHSLDEKYDFVDQFVRRNDKVVDIMLQN